MKSGYKQHWNLHGLHSVMVGSSCTDKEECWWAAVCALKVPSRVIIFLWKVALYIIHAAANLHGHHVPTLPCYFACGAFEATTKHVLFFSLLLNMCGRSWKFGE